MKNSYDVVVAGAGAAGLMAAIFAAREGARVVALDGAKRIGAKILISGGGRCNVTHDVIEATAFNGNRNSIGKVLRTFSIAETVAFFQEIGVELKRESTGKLFPVTDRARTVLDALLGAARDAGAEVLPGHRVTALRPEFVVRTSSGDFEARSVVLASGGRSVPKTGSDGAGYDLARSLGHSVTATFPALVPLILPGGHWMTRLSGTSVDSLLEVRSMSGRVLARQRGPMLFTHFGISGPVVLDISRHWIAHHPCRLVASFLPDSTFELLEHSLLAHQNPQATVASVLRALLSERLIEAVCDSAAVSSVTPLGKLRRPDRRQLIRSLIDVEIPVVRDRGFDYAEVTAGGVPLSEVELPTMQSRIRSRVFLCGEILDVDGRIGGYNFQWAWASGRLAGLSAGVLFR